MSALREEYMVGKATRKSVLDLSHKEASDYFLKSESYCNIDFPPYIVFNDLISGVRDVLSNKKLSDLIRNPREHDDVNYTVLSNKDGKYAWRPLQLIHPAFYVSLVNTITAQESWQIILERFKQFFANDKIRCLSMPIVSQSEERDKAEQVSHWWQEVEQGSIELSLEYEYLLETDITDCYGSIYTHSIAWALHGKTEAKKKDNRNNLNLIGNQIDKHIQDMRHGQTNGIPQGSALMDFIAEMVLGYADLKLLEKINKTPVTDYFILRYRDDYRIFVNNPLDGALIVKLLTEITISLGLKLNPSKTKASDDVVRASLKADKIAWLNREKRARSLQKNLLIIHDHALQFPNSGSLAVALSEYHKRLSKFKIIRERVIPLIAILIDIAYRNPRTYSVCSAILSKLLSFLDAPEIKQIINKIKNKFSQIPNTGHMQIWLQRVTFPVNKGIDYDEPLCRLVAGNAEKIWNIDWITSCDLKQAVDAKKIIDGTILNGIEPIIPSGEIDLFIEKTLNGYYE